MRRLALALVSSLLIATPASAAPDAAATNAVATDAAATDAAEQWLIYDLNRARWDPVGYASEQGIRPAATLIPQPPLAPNDALAAAAGFKAAQTIAYPSQFSLASSSGSHCSTATGVSVCPNGLARQYGYLLPAGWPDDRNFLEAYWASSLPADSPEGVGPFMSSPTHVGMLFQWSNREIGVGWERSCESGRTWRCNVIIIHAAASSPQQPLATGVVFDDLDGDGLMDLGEGLPDIRVTIGSTGTTTNAGGGYTLPLIPGPTEITATIDGIAVTGSFTAGSYSVGADFVRGAARPVIRAYRLCQGLQPTIMGTDGDDTLVGTPGDDVIQGLDGNDTISGNGGTDTICGGYGADVIDGVGEVHRTPLLEAILALASSSVGLLRHPL